MDVKLTVKLNEVSIANAKQYAAQNGISLSKLIENFFDGISLRMEGEKQNENLYSPLVNELAGIISLPDDFDYKTDYENYLRENMNKIFVDSDVILDLLAHRVPHFHFSALLFTFGDMNKIELYTSPTVFCNVFYILRKELGIEKAKESLRKLRLIVKVIDSSEKTIDSALNSVFSDFEDAIQYYTAQNHQISTIVTRNLKDYKVDGIVVQTPEMFLCSAGLL